MSTEQISGSSECNMPANRIIITLSSINIDGETQSSIIVEGVHYTNDDEAIKAITSEVLRMKGKYDNWREAQRKLREAAE